VAVCPQELAQLNQPYTTLDFVYSTAAQLNFEAAYASAQGRRSVATSVQDSATSAQDSEATSAQDSATSAQDSEATSAQDSATSAQDSEATSADASDAADAGGADAAGRRRAELMVEQRVRLRSLLLERLFDAMRELVREGSTLRAFVAVLITLMAEPSEITGRSRCCCHDVA
jgi:chemotaxis protein histidine kinase CheA